MRGSLWEILGFSELKHYDRLSSVDVKFVKLSLKERIRSSSIAKLHKVIYKST